MRYIQLINNVYVWSNLRRGEPREWGKILRKIKKRVFILSQWDVHFVDEKYFKNDLKLVKLQFKTI